MASSASSTTVAAAQSSAAVIGAAGAQNSGIWDSARHLFTFNFPKITKEHEFNFQFLTSPQRAKPASTLHADDFYMYACGSLNMP